MTINIEPFDPAEYFDSEDAQLYSIRDFMYRIIHLFLILYNYSTNLSTV